MQVSFSKALTFTTAAALITSGTAQAYLDPLIFNEMYAYATAGNVSALNSARHRGLNINAVNQNGDTGVCVAIQRNDHTAYNTFLRVGASSRPACLNKISSQQYNRFMKTSDEIKTANLKDDDDNSIWWWIGGAAVVGGVALALSGGGGGGGSDPVPVPEPEPEPDPEPEMDGQGLGYVVGTVDPHTPEVENYDKVIISTWDGENEINNSLISLTNNSGILTGENKETLLTDAINLDEYIDLYTQYLQVAMRAYNASEAINSTNGNINLGNGTVGITAVKNSTASNLGKIEINAENATIGMVVSDSSKANNNGTITMNFSGSQTSDSLIGMYADTNSSLINSSTGKITANAEGTSGKITGMQLHITNISSTSVNTAENSGTIEMTATDGITGMTNLWGMSSWLDNIFINGTQSATDLDSATLTNNGTINLLYTSTNSGTDTNVSSINLANGNGGVVAMHADANTTAINNNIISITATGDAGAQLAAGMHAARGGDLANNKEITVSADGTAYGMMAVNGANTGDNFSTAESNIDNLGTITITAGEINYGIYSETKGTITNTGTITLNGSGYGIFNKNGNVNSSGDISISGANSYAIYAQNTEDLNNSSRLTLEGENSYGIYADTVASLTNSGTINIKDKSYGIYTTGSEVINTGNINLNGNNSYGIYTTGSEVINTGNINLNGNNSYGIYAVNDNITNNGESGQGIISINGTDNIGFYIKNATVVNNRPMNINNGNNVGVFVENGTYTQNDRISIVNGTGSSAFYITGGNIYTNNNFYISSGDINQASNIAINVVTTENTSSPQVTIGNSIHLDAPNAVGVNINAASGTSPTITSNATFATLETANGDSNNVTAFNITGNGTPYVSNSGNIILNQNNSYGFNINSSNAQVTNGENETTSGTININGINSYGFYITDGNITNYGSINLNGSNNYGIYANGGTATNNGTISVNGNSNRGIHVANGDVTNTGKISVNGTRNNGIRVIGGTIANTGTININGSSNSGVHVEGGTVTGNNAVSIISGYGSNGYYITGGNVTINSSFWLSSGDTNESQNIGINVTSIENSSSPYVDITSSSGIHLDTPNNIGVNVNAASGTSPTVISNATFSTPEATDGVANNVIGINILGSGSPTVENYGNMNFNHDNSAGIVFNSTGGTLTNKGNITLNGTNGYGIYSSGGGTITNNGSITLGSTGNTGIYSSGSANITNTADFSISTNDSQGIYLGNTSKLNNSGAITVGVEDNSVGGAVGINNESSTADAVINSGEITVYGKSMQNQTTTNYGIKTTSGSVTNLANVYILNGTSSIAYGISVGGETSPATLINSGNIEVRGSTPTPMATAGIYARSNSTVTNSGAITIVGGGTGIYNSSGSVTNSGAITIDGGGTGIYNFSGSVTNNSNITVNDGKGFSIVDGNVTNNSNITVNDGNGFSITGGNVTNNGNITVENGNGFYISGDKANAIVNNYNPITVNGGIGINIEGQANFNNYEYATITVNAEGTNGIRITGNGTVDNDAMIKINASRVSGIHMENGTLTNDNGISVGSQNVVGSNGFYISGGNATINSSGWVFAGGSGKYESNVFINAQDANSPTINVSSNSNIHLDGDNTTGIYAAASNGKSVNITSYATITAIIEGISNVKALSADSSNGSSNITNYGPITMNGISNYALFASGSGASITHYANTDSNGDGFADGLINMIGTFNAEPSQYSIVAYARDGGKITIYGNSSLVTSVQTTAPWATGTKLIVAVANEGSVTFNDVKVKFSDLSATLDEQYTGTSTLSLSATNGGTINLVSCVFDTEGSNLELEGNVVFDKETQIIAENVSGSAVASSSTVQNSNDVSYVMEGNFSGNTDKLTVSSQSYLFNAQYDGNKVVLTKKDFSDVVEDKQLAQYLEQNYSLGNNLSLFDDLKEASSYAQLNNKINRETGRDFLPALAIQSLSLMKDLHRQLNNAWFAAQDDEHILTGFNYYNRQHDYNQTLSNSNDYASSLFALFKHQYNDVFSLGAGISLTKFDSKFDNDTSRDEIIAELMLPLSFKTDNFNLLGNIYAGYGFGDYKRYTDRGRFKGDLKNYYYGMTNELRTNINTGFYDITIQPTAEFNIHGFYQKQIHDGGLNINHNNNISVESGLGLFAEKTFNINDNNSFRLRAGGTWYHEFNDDYQTLKGDIEGFNGIYTLDEVEMEKDRALFSINGEYKTGALSFYGEAAYETGSDNNWIFNAGIKYAF